MNIDWQEMGKLLDQALENTIFKDAGENALADELNNAWNRGAKSMLNETLILFIKKEREESA